MTDRELLMQAATAAGLRFDPERLHEASETALWLPESRMWWCPLTEDGDALRLAVKLRLLVLPAKSGEIVTVDSYTAIDEATENARHDAYAATRRAIVRAAVSISGAALKRERE